MPIPACSSDDSVADQRAAFVRYLRAGRRAPSIELKCNRYHNAETGQFTTADDAGATSEGLQEAQLSPVAILRGAGRLAGVAFPPADVGAVIVDNIVGAPLASDMLPPGVLIAQNNKQKRSKISGLQARIADHRMKLHRDPDNESANHRESANHWRSEIRAWTTEIERIHKRLPGRK